MRGRAQVSSEDEEEEPHPDPEEDLHDDLPQGRAQQHGRRGRAQHQADQGGATLIVLYRHICRCANIALTSCNCVYNCPRLFSFDIQMFKYNILC